MSSALGSSIASVIWLCWRVWQDEALRNLIIQALQVTMRITAMVDINGRTLRHDFTGRVRGDTVEGTLRLFDKVESSAPWSAARTGGKAASIDPLAGAR